MLNDLPNDQAQKAYGIIRENLVRYQTPFIGGYPAMQPMQPMQPVMAPVMPQQAAPPMAAAGGVVCKKCGQRSAPGTRFCGSCGSQL